MSLWSRDSFWWRATHVIREKTIERVLNFRNHQYTALLLVEFVLCLTLVASIVLWLDYRYNTVEFPFNIFLFGLSMYAVLHFYGYTHQFRKHNSMKRHTSFLIFLLEFLIFVIIVVAGYVYEDPTINTFPYPFNFILFLLILLPVVYVHMNEKFIKPAFAKR